MKLKIFFLFLAISFSAINVNAQIGDDISHFFKMGGKIISSPIKFDSNDLLNITFTAVTTTGSYFLDNTGRQWALNNRNSFNNNFFNFDNSSNFVIAGGIAGLYGYGLIDKNDKVRKLGLSLAEATIYSTGITYVLKSVLGRSRPFRNTGHNDFNPFQTSEDKTSFPSGHITAAFAFSTVMADQIDNMAWKIGWYGAATFVGISRVYHDKHWASDIVLGSAIGYFVGRFVLNNQNDDKEITGETKHNKTTYFLGLKYFNNQPIYSLNFGYSF